MNVNLAELDERIDKCQGILDADPNSQIFAALAEAYRKKGDVQRALEICSSGLKKHPDYGLAYIVLVKIYLAQGRYEEADMYLQKAIKVGGRTRSVDILQSEIFIKMGHTNKAKNILERLQKSDQQSQTIKNLLVSIEKDEHQLPVVSGYQADTKPQMQFSNAESPNISISTHAVDNRNYTISNALTIIKILPRVLGVIAVAKDGMVIEGHFDGQMTGDELGALAVGYYNSISQGISKIKYGEPLEIMIEAAESKLWIVNKMKMLIVIVTRDDVNLGSLRLKVNEVFKYTDFS